MNFTMERLKMFKCGLSRWSLRWLTTLFLMISICCRMTNSAPGVYGQNSLKVNSTRSSISSGVSSDDRSGHRERHTKETLVETSTGKLRGLRRNVFGKVIII